MNCTTTSAAYTWAELARKLGISTDQANSQLSAQPRSKGTSQGDAMQLEDLMLRRCKDGERTEHLTKLVGKLLAAGVPAEPALQLCQTWNSQNIEPLDSDKIDATFHSIHACDLRNHPERYPGLRTHHQPLFDLSAGSIQGYLSTDPAPRRWLLKDLLVQGKVGAIVAPGGSSKSQWLLQLAVSVASGLPVAEHWQIGETGRVLVFFAEDDNDEIHRRLKRITDHHMLAGNAAQLADLKDRLYVFSTIGVDTLLTKRDVTGEVRVTSIVQGMAALAQQITDLKLIIIDPASRFRGGEENSNEDATRFVEALETLAKQTGATVLIAHHTNKGSYGSDAEPGQGAARGASALTDGLRWQMNLSRPSEKQLSSIGASKDQANRYVAATVTKTNYSAYPPAAMLERLDNGYLTAITPTQMQQRAENAAIMRVVALLMQQPKPISARQLEDQFGGVTGLLKLPKHDVRHIVQLATQRGLIAGGDRKPLTVSTEGRKIFEAVAPSAAEVASQAVEKKSRKKT